ncbi:MAG: flavodoxin family protein [Eubacteriales bacterium]|nr:flavodoxin family protein [Eubacteriales bacterium]
MKQKKILILSASPRRGGNSDTLCDQFAKGAREVGHQAEKIFLSDKQVRYCTGCGLCNGRRGSCSQRDDMEEIARKMIAADVIVMATPVYFYTMAAQMKTLIDRCCAYYTDMQDKEFYFIVAAADNDVPAMERTIEGFRGFTLCLDGAVEKGVVYGVGAWGKGEIERTPAMREAYELGRQA